MKVTLQFSANPLIGSKLIRLVTWSDYSHVDIVLPDGQLLGAIAFGGVCVHAPRTNYSKRDLFTFEAPDDFIEKAMLDAGVKAYDWWACIGIGLHRDLNRDDFFECASWILYCTIQSACPLLRLEKWWRATPELLLMSPLLKPAA